MNKLNIEGKLIIESNSHEVEYEPGAMVGLSTLFLRVAGKNHNVPIFVKDVEHVIDMLKRGRAVIEALENDATTPQEQ